MKDVAFLLAIGILAFLFAGDPDLTDAIRVYITNAAACK